ncbi:MAG TPA: helix-turn-helix domain-containing protein [Draconibacterium sp.]|nr:helix-turn-helix domain-containing protein [Draconibacterium sp.]
MSVNNIFSNEDFSEGDFIISLASNKLPLKSSLAKVGRCIICYCFQGSAEVEVNLTKHTFCESEILVLFPSQIVEQKYVSPDFSVMYFTLAPHIFQEVTFRFPPAFLNFLRSHFYYRVGEEAVKEEQVRFSVIRQKFLDTNNLCRREILMNILRIFFLELYDKIRRDELTHSGFKYNRRTELYESFCNLIMQHYKKQRDVLFYADLLNISPKYLSIITKEFSNLGAKQWIDDYVILELKVKLKSGNESMQEVADEFCFSDIAFMSKYFKSRTGISPSVFRAG